MFYHVIYEVYVDDIYIVESTCEDGSDIPYSCEIIFTSDNREVAESQLSDIEVD